MQTQNFNIGQELIVSISSSRYLGQNSKVTTEKITKIGSKWVYLGDDYRNLKFMKSDPTMALYGGNRSSPGNCYLSQKDYDFYLETRVCKDNLIKLINKSGYYWIKDLRKDQVENILTILQNPKSTYNLEIK